MYKHITKEGKEFDELALILSEGNVKEVYLDIESTGLDARLDKLLLFQVMAGEEIFIYDFTKLNREHLKYLLNLLDFTKVTSIFHNTKFDIKFTYENSGTWMKNLYDTMYTEVLLNAGIGKPLYSLEELALKYSNSSDTMDKEVRKTFFNQEVREFTTQQLNYAALDVKALKDIYTKQMKQVVECKLDKVHKVEMDLLPVVANMEHDGILLNKDAWLKLEEEELAKLNPLSEEIVNDIFDKIKVKNFSNAYELAKALAIRVTTKRDTNLLQSIEDASVSLDWARKNFNMNSSKQLTTALNLIGIPVPNVDKEHTLKKFTKYDIVRKLINHSESEKRVSTYGSNFFKLIHPTTGRIHADFFNMGAASGRFSSGNPNMQNIPNADGYRQCFIASPDYYFLTLDYSQEEYRLAGAVSGEPKIIEAYQKGSDMHTATAANFFDKPLSSVTKQERQWGKTRNFEILYGTTEWGLSNSLKCGVDEAKKILDKYWDGYQVLKKFKDYAEEKIVELGYSITPLGRRRYNIEKPTYMTNWEYMRYSSRIKREGFNHIIQGAGADIIKIAMINIYNKNPFGDKLRLLIQVHDELDAEAHESVRVDAAEFMKEEMLKAEQPFLGEIPAAVDVKYDTTFWAK
jgi:DNA polymerase I-like protein with 3'-5' exonuclease and polymerase domains